MGEILAKREIMIDFHNLSGTWKEVGTLNGYLGSKMDRPKQ